MSSQLEDCEKNWLMLPRLRIEKIISIYITMPYNFPNAIFDGVFVASLFSIISWVVINLIDEKERGLERGEQINELFSRLEDCEKQTADVGATPN